MASQGTPRLSVVMPARNALPYLDAAIGSILAQTFPDFEFVIRDDGSTDGTRERLRHWARQDSRIRLFEGEKLGPAGSSNWVVQQARAPIVARMDADDVSRPSRLERQLALFAQSETVLAGTLADTIDARGRKVRDPDYWRLCRRSCFLPFPHTSIMFRRSAFDAVGGYRPQCDYWEDLDFCLRLSALGEVSVIADALVSYRTSASSVRLVPTEQERVEVSVEKMFRSVEAIAKDGCYEAVVAKSGEPPPARVRPLTFVSIGSSRLWAGERPRLMRRLLRRGRLGLDVESALTLGWTALAVASPRTLRLLLKTLNRFRSVRARARITPGAVYPWRPHPSPRSAGEGRV
ncbi:MAG TPA: glycosyltransferase family A protein [Allosphingosinicella sp.]|jgi:glycosyltransferase involved in cell wall biosynthesis